MPLAPPLALARTGGQGGQVWVYAEDHESEVDRDSSFLAGGGRRWF
jgi:hypothetical protein